MGRFEGLLRWFFLNRKGFCEIMGGYGSGRQDGWRRTVESSLTLSATKIGRNFWGRGSLQWSANGEPYASMGYERRGPLALALSYAVSGVPHSDLLTMETTRPHYGGVRYWWECPGCYRQVAKLYFQRAQWKCRTCHGLTYQSCKDSRQHSGLYNLMARQLGTDAREVRRALKG